ncbi:MAG: hypothetical protein JXD22_05160 [Sedimentisphaerales bacterium]|nr:hypothetical protein [Sedimentisphaerales bacterium]
MSDTSEKIDAIYRDRIMALSAGERLRMATSMFSTAKKLMAAGISSQERDLTSARLRARMFLRLYGNDFSEAEQDKIITSLPDMQR